MNEEEKAIKIVNSLKEWGKTHFIVKDRSYARLTYNEVYLLLNLIDKQNTSINKLKTKNNDLLRKLRNRVKENKKLAKYSQYKKEFSTLNKQIDKQNKVIDLMSWTFTHTDISQDEYCKIRTANCEQVGGTRECKDCIKQYFIRKVEEDE